MKKISTKKITTLALGCLFSTSNFAQADENNMLSVETKKDTMYMVPSGSMNFNTYYHLNEHNSTGGLNIENIGKKDTKNEQTFLIHDITGNLKLEFGIPYKEDEEKTAGVVVDVNLSKNTLNTNSGKLSVNTFYAHYGNFIVGHHTGIFGGKSTQVQFKHTINENMNHALSIEQTPNAYNPENLADGVKNENIHVKKMIPAGAYNIKYHGESGHVKLSGLLRPMEYHNKKDEKDTMLLGYGTKIDAEWKIMPKKLNVTLSGAYGKGVSSYLGAKAENDIVMNFKKLEDTILLPVITASGNVEIYFIEDILSANFAGNMIMIGDEESNKKRKDNDYNMGISVSGGLKYHMNKQVNIGIQYTHGIKNHVKDTKDDDMGVVKATVAYKF